MESKIKPCPFCGGIDIDTESVFVAGDKSWWGRSWCYTCEASSNVYGNDHEEVFGLAIDRWNTRNEKTAEWLLGELEAYTKEQTCYEFFKSEGWGRIMYKARELCKTK